MRWLLHGNLTPAVAEALKRHEHTVFSFAELGIADGATNGEVVRAAQAKQWDIITVDHDLVNAVFEDDIWFNRSIVFLQLPGGDVEQDDAMDRLFTRYKRLTPGRLYTVTETRSRRRSTSRRQMAAERMTRARPARR
jgi:predicted nuclease of predicted toxin-antitoxin system